MIDLWYAFLQWSDIRDPSILLLFPLVMGGGMALYTWEYWRTERRRRRDMRERDAYRARQAAEYQRRKRDADAHHKHEAGMPVCACTFCDEAARNLVPAPTAGAATSKVEVSSGYQQGRLFDQIGPGNA